MSAPSRSITPRRSRIIVTPTLSPALTETIDRPSLFAPKKMLPSIPLSAPFFAKVARLRRNQRQRPFLEFKVVILAVAPPRGHVARALDVLRHAVGDERHPLKRIAQPLFDQPGGEVGDINADPRSPEFWAG